MKQYTLFFFVHISDWLFLLCFKVQSDAAAGPGLTSILHSGHLHPPRAAKPPVTRLRLGFLEMMTEQHELSAIQEVETPVDASQLAGLLSCSKTWISGSFISCMYNTDLFICFSCRPRQWCDSSFTHWTLGSAGGVRLLYGFWQDSADNLGVQQWTEDLWKIIQLRDKFREIQPLERETATDRGRSISRILHLWWVEKI